MRCGSVVSLECQHDLITAAFQYRDHKIADVVSHTFTRCWNRFIVVVGLLTAKITTPFFFFFSQKESEPL